MEEEKTRLEKIAQINLKKLPKGKNRKRGKLREKLRLPRKQLRQVESTFQLTQIQKYPKKKVQSRREQMKQGA